MNIDELEKLRKRIHTLSKTNKQLKQLAFTDPLTKVYNRNWFNNNINKDAKVYLVLADLNNLKTVNDTDGHAEGDKLIVQVAKSFTKYGNVVRFGGDEFIVLPRDKASYDELLSLRCDHFCAGGVEPHEYDNIAKAINLADKRLYQNKKLFKTKN